jgi:hypothetical protein
MPKQSLLRFIKRWKRYEPRKSWSHIPPHTRGVYALYSNGVPKEYRVVYIGVAGISVSGGGGIRSRIKRHDRKIKKWTHYSLYEVHDNVTRDEIREMGVATARNLSLRQTHSANEQTNRVKEVHATASGQSLENWLEA